jgi:hypothetical protein
MISTHVCHNPHCATSFALTSCSAPMQPYSKTKTVVVSTTTTTTTTYMYTPTASPTKRPAKATSVSTQRAAPATQMHTHARCSKIDPGAKSKGPHPSTIAHPNPPDLGLVLPRMAPIHMPAHATGKCQSSSAELLFSPLKASMPKSTQQAPLPPHTPLQAPLQTPPTFTWRYDCIVDPSKLLRPKGEKKGYHVVVCGQEVGVFHAR